MGWTPEKTRAILRYYRGSRAGPRLFAGVRPPPQYAGPHAPGHDRPAHPRAVLRLHPHRDRDRAGHCAPRIRPRGGRRAPGGSHRPPRRAVDAEPPPSPRPVRDGHDRARGLRVGQARTDDTQQAPQSEVRGCRRRSCWSPRQRDPGLHLGSAAGTHGPDHVREPRLPLRLRIPLPQRPPGDPEPEDRPAMGVLGRP